MNLPSPIEQVEYPLFHKYGVCVWVKRDDLIHPIVSGNKFRKLKYILKECKRDIKHTGIISFGGAFSNHAHALAFVCYAEQIPCTLFIRSASGKAIHNETINDILKWGARVVFVSPQEYKRRESDQYLRQIESQFKGHLIIPEGGSHQLAIEGVKEGLLESRRVVDKFDFLIVPVGTGATLAGLAEGLEEGERLLGISALKSDKFSVEVKKKWSLEERKEIQVLTQWHWGGYGKTPERLLRFIRQFLQSTGIELDPIYNGKSMYALCEFIRFGLIGNGTKVLFIHTGGLQGWRGKRNTHQSTEK
ncbi:1-aminocyclopropane-1-carboxylate deaminase/D-cysteine desulfhydrase [Membranihabitans maritimus]|uniref:1-aminocyclopropane-1-carboxylate deaminase/D-cysteine desulfhydrase n=1 Tax=Membranihabitans maritimus TaxID=2904244 RepID=UPI001F36CC29|nr:pyridoxal-phosphate dependent enzyme [Membranihabitans maritimus]